MKVSDVAGAQMILCSHSSFFFHVLIKREGKKKAKQHFPEDKLVKFTLDSYHQQHKTKEGCPADLSDRNCVQIQVP